MDLNYLPTLFVNTAANPPVKDTHATFGFHPSSSSVEWEIEGRKTVEGACLREQYYKHAEVPPSDPPQGGFYLTGHFGNAIHASVVELSKRAGIWRGDEGRFFIPEDIENKRPPVSGRWDLFIRDPHGSRPIGCEVKTIYGYWPEKQYLGDNGRPRESDILQSLVYLDYYGRFGVEMWILLYISRGSGEMKQYHIRIGEDGEAIIDGTGFQESYPHITVQKIYSRWWKLREKIEAKELPDRDYTTQWSNPIILYKYQKGDLNQKDSRAVKKKLENGETEGALLIKGDWRCGFCWYRSICYGVEWDDSYSRPQVIRPFRDPVLNDPTNVPEPEVTSVI